MQAANSCLNHVWIPLFLQTVISCESVTHCPVYRLLFSLYFDLMKIERLLRSRALNGYKNSRCINFTHILLLISAPLYCMCYVRCSVLSTNVWLISYQGFNQTGESAVIDHSISTLIKQSICGSNFHLITATSVGFL